VWDKNHQASDRSRQRKQRKGQRRGSGHWEVTKKVKEALKVVREAVKSQCCRRTTARAPEGTKTETRNLEETVPKASLEGGSEGTL